MKHLTVEQAIKELQKLPKSAIFAQVTRNFEQGHALVASSGIRSFKGSFVKRTFRDAFDGETYTSTVIEENSNNGGKTFVEIS